MNITDKNTFDRGERQSHLSAPWINPDFSYGTIWNSVIKSPFFAGGTERGIRKKEMVQAVVSYVHALNRVTTC